MKMSLNKQSTESAQCSLIKHIHTAKHKVNSSNQGVVMRLQICRLSAERKPVLRLTSLPQTQLLPLVTL